MQSSNNVSLISTSSRKLPLHVQKDGVDGEKPPFDLVNSGKESVSKSRMRISVPTQGWRGYAYLASAGSLVTSI
jgi:hypothetical protein